MLQGIVDHYILPSIANATSLALGLDEAGPAYEPATPSSRSSARRRSQTLLPLAGRDALALPATGNVDAARRPRSSCSTPATRSRMATK